MPLNRTINNFTDYISPALPFTAVFILLIFSQFHSYLFFHTSVEIFSVIIAFGIFMFAWNTRKISKNGYFLFLGIAYLSVGIIDFMHTLSYKGMNIFPGFDSNLPTQLWVGGRYLLAASLLISPVFINRKINEWVTLVVYALIVTFLLLSTYYFKIFPESFREGVGLTPFKIYSEYIVSALLLISILVLVSFRKKFDKAVFVLLLVSFIANIISELLFTRYLGVYDFANMLGHLGKLISYYLMYKAIIVVGLTKPYGLMFMELKEADRMKDEFLSVASHEFRTPITTIKSYAQILKSLLKGNKDSKLLLYATKLESETDRLTQLVNELLDVSRIQSGKLALVKERVNLSALVKELIEDMQRITPTHQIIVEGNLNKRVLADEQRLRQVLINLISNAIAYSPKAKRVIVRLSSDNRNVWVSIEDFGIGLKKNSLSRVFERFFQAENKVRTSHRGLGLGLYICRQIIRQHNGEIWAESKKGEGSTFTFKLPFKGY